MSEIRTGFVTQTHSGDVSIDEAIELGGELGFDYVELYMDGATERTRLDPDAVTSALAERDLDLLVHLPFVDLDLGTPRDRIRDATLAEQRACIEAAAGMGAEKAVLHADSRATPPEWDPDEVRPHRFESVRELDAFGDDRGVKVCVENLPGVAPTIDDFDALFDETEASMTLDTGHARVDGFDSADTAAFAAEHADRISHLHVNDARTAADEHVPTGSGTIDFAAIFDALDAEGWTGTASVEVYTFDPDYLAISKRKLDEFMG